MRLEGRVDHVSTRRRVGIGKYHGGTQSVLRVPRLIPQFPCTAKVKYVFPLGMFVLITPRYGDPYTNEFY